MKKWQPVDVIITLLTLLICFIFSSLALTPLIRGTEFSEDKAALMAGLLGSILSIIALYVGTKINGSSPNEPEDP